MAGNTLAHAQPRPAEAELLAYLKAHELFAKFSAAILQDFLAEMAWVCLPVGETLFRQGDPGGFLYLVFQGRLQVAITREDGTEMIVAEVGPGKPLGEIQFLSGGTRTASVTALHAAALLKFSRTAFERLTDQNPEILRQMAEIIRQRLRRDQLVAMLPNLCGPVDTAILKDLELETEWLSLSQGAALFRQGEPGDSFFLLISGRLQAVVFDARGQPRIVGEIRRGETVGEIAMFTGEDRTATVLAMRDSELVKFSQTGFERITALYPKLMLRIMQTLIKRLQKTQNSVQAASPVLNIAVASADPETPLNDFTERLVNALALIDQTLHLSSDRVERLLDMPSVAQTPEDDPNNIRLAAWLDEQEAKYTTIVYETDRFDSPWTRRCIQHADRILLVAQAAANPTPGKIERTLLSARQNVTNAHQILVLLHPNGHRLPSNTSQWLAHRRVKGHQHVRWNVPADFERLARFLTGNAVGLVLGGGGARGLAHIGVIRALAEAGIPIDMVGGTSIGGAIAALHAMGLDYRELLRCNRKIWIESKPFNDYTLPLLSLIKGRKFEQVARVVYGATQIEDLWTNYFCVSTNLTTTEAVVHQAGLLARALRATAALPGIAVPLVEQRNLLVDGGVLNNLPVDIMRELGGGFVIAVDVSPEKDLTVECAQFPSPWKVLWQHFFPAQPPVNVPNIVDLLMRATMVGSIHQTNAVKTAADIYLQPPVARFKLLDFKAFDEIVQVGYEYARKKLEDWEPGS